MIEANEFAAFHEELYGYRPFPWQSRLASEVIAQGRWPDLLDLPTGAGKTTAMDIAVFALAADASAGRPQRFPRRVILVVDRRLVVDQAGARARHLAERLQAAPPASTAGRVAEALRALSGEDTPLVTAVLRGGMPREDGWSRSPGQVVLAASTVDQVGSRLLFRGYGVSDGAAPIHAGLLGHDTLFLLDEVHLSQPFAQTLEALTGRYAAWSQRPLPRPSAMVRLSATAADRSGVVFGLSAEDRAHAVLARRLSAQKPARLVTASKATEEAFVQACAHEARTLLKVRTLLFTTTTVGVVVNRVASARAIHAALAGAEGFDAVLLTGRMRPLERDALVAQWEPRLRAGRARRADDRPVIVVATQCIEAGADLDFDALVTECASFDALVQRLGRLDRLGDVTALGGAAQAVVVGRRDQVTGKESPDPIYGGALRATWDWLEAQGALSLGPGQLPAEVPEALLSPKPDAPLMLPAHLDLWAQTKPRPAVEPEVESFLHGFERGAPEVQIVWRGDLDEALLLESSEEAMARVHDAPPGSIEALSLPIYAARAWLEGLEVAALSDVEGEERPEEERSRKATAFRPAVLWRGDDSVIAKKARDIRPGDTVVVPSSYGGQQAGCWAPEAVEPVSDLGDVVQVVARSRAVLRLHPSVIPSGVPSPPSPPDEDSDGDGLEALETWCAQVAGAAQTPTWLRDAAGHLGPALGRRGRAHARTALGPGGHRHVVLVGLRRLKGGGEDFDMAGGSSFTAREVTLREHLAGVEARARGAAIACGLDADRVEDLALAARLHDLGKVDPRFQRWLHGGDEIRALAAAEPLAKSALPAHDARARERARKTSGYPRGARHELVSVALAASNPAALASARDPELVLHLIATHHGYARPLAPARPDPAPVALEIEAEGARCAASSAHGLERLDSGVAERFWRLVGRYGWHGLAWLEAMLRLADHRQSEAEQRADEPTREGGR